MAKEKPTAKDKAPAKPTLTKTAFFQELAEATEMKKADVMKVYDAIIELVRKQLGPKGPGIVTLPNLAKLTAQHTKADKGGKKAKNPFTGEEYITKPRPAKTRLKARGLKNFLESITKK
jgi:nucleoid DNA-binding protein